MKKFLSLLTAVALACTGFSQQQTTTIKFTPSASPPSAPSAPAVGVFYVDTNGKPGFVPASALNPNLIWATPASGTGSMTLRSMVAADLPNTAVTPGSYTASNITVDAQGRITAAANGAGGGGVTSVGQTFTGGLISVSGSPVTTTGTLALTVAGTSGGVPYFSSASTWASSSALASNALVLGGGAGAAPKTAAGFTTDGTSILTLGVAGSSVGTVAFKNATSGTASVIPPTGALGTYSVTLPNAASTLPIFSQQITFTGPTAARTITLPDAAFTVARTDAANTFTGVQTMTSPSFTTSIVTASTTIAVFNTTATTVNAFGGASTALNIGNASGQTAMLGIIGFDGATPSSSTAAIFPAATTALSSLRLPHGAAPTSPVNGDVWTTTTAMFVRINGVTQQLGTATVPGSDTQVVFNDGGAFGADAGMTYNKSTDSLTLVGSIRTGSGGGAAGFVEFGQGTAPSAGTTSITLYAPSSVTSYIVALPGAAASGVPVWSNSANVVTESVVAPGTSGNVLTSNGTTWVSSAATGGTAANPTASVALSAVNGVATTYMRSDAAPALSVAIAPTWTGVHNFSPAARSSGVASYFVVTTPADTSITAATESVGVDFTTATRSWATTGTVTNQREIFFRGKTYASAGASQTFTDISTVAITPPIAGTNAIFTRGHSLQIVDSTSAASSITGGLVVAAALGTTATSTGIGNGNINTGGTLTVGGTQTFTGATTHNNAVTINGAAATTALTITNTARTSGVLPYIKWTIPTDTGQTASTESPGLQVVSGTRTWATTGTVALQRENFFAGPTYASASASQTFTDAFTMYITPPVAGTNAIFTRGHSLGIVDSTSAASSITGGLVVATTLGTTATSVGIGGGNINAGGTITAGGSISNGTSNSLSTGTIELGAASDTTIARVSAGTISVEGVTVDTISGTNTLTNKRITPRITAIGSGATPTVNTDNCDCVNITGLAVDITSMTTNLSGTPTEFQQLEYRITGTAARAITWGASFVAGPTALPTTTVTTKALHVYFEWDTVQSKWVCMSSGSDA